MTMDEISRETARSANPSLARGPHDSAGILRMPEPKLVKDRAYEVLKAAILNLALPPGTSLKEADLCERLRPCLPAECPSHSQALHQLEREGFVEMTPFRGATVTKVGPRDIEELFEVRIALEGYVMEEVCRRKHGAAQVWMEEQYAGAAEAMSRGDIKAASDANFAFHEGLILRWGNARLAATYAQMIDHYRRIRFVAGESEGRVEKSVGEHRRILEAVRGFDGPGAREATVAHLRSLLADLLASEKTNALRGT